MIYQEKWFITGQKQANTSRTRQATKHGKRNGQQNREKQISENVKSMKAKIELS